MVERADLLMTMGEAKDDFYSQKKAAKTAERRREQDKERMGAVSVDAATGRSSSSGSEDGKDE